MGKNESLDRTLLSSPWNLIEELADEETKALFGLDDILIGISLKIVNYRISNNLTQTKLAQNLGVSQAMVSKLESGTYNPTIEQLWRLSKKLGWNFKVLFDEGAQLHEDNKEKEPKKKP